MIASNRSYESVSNATKRGFLLPVVDEHGRPWTAWRVAAEIATMTLLFGGLVVLWCVL